MRLVKLLFLILMSETQWTGRLWAAHREWSQTRKPKRKVFRAILRQYVMLLLIVEITRWRCAAELALQYGDVRTIQMVGDSLKGLATELEADREYVVLGDAIKASAEEVVLRRNWSWRWRR